jgi:hypothetical protein
MYTQTVNGRSRINMLINSQKCKKSTNKSSRERVSWPFDCEKHYVLVVQVVPLYERIATAYEIAKIDFTKDLTSAAAKKIGPRNRRVEHIVLTSESVPTKDALALVWHRNREPRNK